MDCLPGGDAVAEVFEAINIAADVSFCMRSSCWSNKADVLRHPATCSALALQAFEGINSKVSNSIEELLDSIEGPFEQALKKSNQVAEQLTGVVSVAKGLVNNEVFQAVLGGLEAFNRAITARVKFTINLGTLCLWVGVAAQLIQHGQHLQPPPSTDVSCSCFLGRWTIPICLFCIRLRLVLAPF